MKEGQTWTHTGTLQSAVGVWSLWWSGTSYCGIQKLSVFIMYRTEEGANWSCQDVSLGEQSPAVSIWEEEEAAVAGFCTH